MNVTMCISNWHHNECFKSIARVLQEYRKSITNVLHEYCKSIAKALQEYRKSIARATLWVSVLVTCFLKLWHPEKICMMAFSLRSIMATGWDKDRHWTRSLRPPGWTWDRSGCDISVNFQCLVSALVNDAALYLILQRMLQIMLIGVGHLVHKAGSFLNRLLLLCFA